MARRVRVRDRVRPEWRFPLRFLGLVAVLYTTVGMAEPLRDVITHVVLLGVPTASSLFGVAGETGSSGVTSFADGRFAYAVTFGCTGVSGIVLLVSAIGAYPSTRRYPIALWQRLSASVVAVVGLMLLNYVRLGALAWIGVNAPNQFDAAHIYWFQGLTIMAVGFGWLAWVRLVVQRDPDQRVAQDTVRDLSRSVTRYASVFAALTAIGVLLGPAHIYAESVGFGAWLLSPFVWGVNLLRPVLGSDHVAYLYGGQIALFALIVATPRCSLKQSLRRLGVLGSFLVVAQVAALAAQFGLATGHAANNPVFAFEWAALHELLILPFDLIVAPIPLALWFSWAEARPVRWSRRRPHVVSAVARARRPSR